MYRCLLPCFICEYLQSKDPQGSSPQQEGLAGHQPRIREKAQMEAGIGQASELGQLPKGWPAVPTSAPLLCQDTWFKRQESSPVSLRSFTHGDGDSICRLCQLPILSTQLTPRGSPGGRGVWELGASSSSTASGLD